MEDPAYHLITVKSVEVWLLAFAEGIASHIVHLLPYPLLMSQLGTFSVDNDSYISYSPLYKGNPP